MIYLIYFSLMVAVKMAGFYDGQVVFKVALIVYAGLFVLKLLVSDFTKKEWAISVLLLLLSVIVYFRTGEKGLFFCFSMMLGMKNVSKKRVFIAGLSISVALMIFNVVTRVLGVFNEIYFSTYRIGVGTQIRHSLGYAHPNTLHISFFVLTIMAVYLSTKYRFHVICISAFSFLLNLYIYQYSGSRTGVLASILYICINLIMFYFPKGKKVYKVIGYASYPLTCVTAIVFPLVLNGKLFSIFDDYIFNFRYSIARFFIGSNPISLFGIRLYYPEQIPYGIDMANLYLFLQLGIVSFLIVSALNILFVYRTCKEGLYAELAVFMAIVFAGIWEPFLYNASYKNIVFVFIGAIIFKSVEPEWDRKFDIPTKRLGQIVMISIVISFIITGMFCLIGSKPGVMYADIEEPGIEETVDGEAISISLKEQQDIIKNGGIILKNAESNTELYKYSDSALNNEYKLRILSVFTFSCLLFIMVGVLKYCWDYKVKKKEVYG